MICYRCQKHVDGWRTVKVRDGIGTTHYCKHCYKATGGE